MARPQQSASPITLAALFGLVAAGTVLLGIGAWSLINGDDTTTESTTDRPATSVEADPEAPTQASSEPASGPGSESGPADGTDGQSVSGSGDEELIERAEGSPVILVRGDTDQGWAIESPDEFGFYPIGGAGPDTFTTTTSSGFAQTPEGAGLAAIHILQRVRPANPDWRAAVDQGLVGAGVAGHIASIETLTNDADTLAAALEATALKSAWVGWNVTAFYPQVAELRLAGIGSLDGDELRYVLDVRLEWLDGDWRVVTTAPDGSDISAVSRVADHGRLDVDLRSAFAL